jgi:glycine oxidase
MSTATQPYTVAIVGGGMAGLSTAYWLLKAGVHIRLMSDGYLNGATWAAAGMLCPTHELDATELPLLHLGLRSLELHRQWATEPWAREAGYQFEGVLDIAPSSNDTPLLERQYAFQRTQGLPVEWLSGRALLQLEPNLAPTVAAGVFSPVDGQVDNRALVTALRHYLEAQGAVVDTLERCTALEPNSNKLVLHTTDQRDGTPNQVECDAAVLCTGLGGVPNRPAPISGYAVKGQMLALHHLSSPLIQRPVRIRTKALGNGYLVPKNDRLIVGSTTEEMGLDNTLTAGGILDVLRRAYAVVPGIYELPLQGFWVGHRPATLSREPFVLPDPELPNVVHVGGLYRHGILLGPAIGQAAAELLLNGKQFVL